MTSSPRPSLPATVLRIATVATIAAVLVWSVLFVDLLRQRPATGATPSRPAVRQSAPAGHTDQAPAPVTTRTS